VKIHRICSRIRIFVSLRCGQDEPASRLTMTIDRRGPSLAESCGRLFVPKLPARRLFECAAQWSKLWPRQRMLLAGLLAVGVLLDVQSQLRC
jgi:hypothetical protein